MKRRVIVLMLVLALAVGCSVSAFASSFKDVKDPSWYSESVDYVVEKGYMAGMSEGIFSPDTMITRAQLTQILYAAEGKPEMKTGSSFTDVPTGKWYSDAVRWGAENTIVAGYPDKTFRPNQAVTREQLVSVMYRYAIYKGYAKALEGGSMGLSGYSDADQIAEWARPGMLWAVQNGILSGTNVGLEPKGCATRAQMAVIIRAFMTKVAASGEEVEPDPSEKPDEPTPSEEPADPSPSVNPDDPQDETPVIPSEDSGDSSSEDSSDSSSDSSSEDSGSESSGSVEDETPLVPAE